MENMEQVGLKIFNTCDRFSFIIGEVRTWDIGTYEPLGDIDMDAGIEKGKLTFILHGNKLKGEFHMIRSRFGSNQRANQWLFMKKKDEFANEQFVLERVLDYGSRRDLQPSTTTKEKRLRQSTTTSPERVVKKR
jgi:bifunctional non-homologous end joining protein LigD